MASGEITNDAPEAMAFGEFLESVPPQQRRPIADLFSKKQNSPATAYYHEVNKPQIQLHCSAEPCNGLRFFRHVGGTAAISTPSGFTRTFLVYQCSNCQTSQKTFAVEVTLLKAGAATCLKFGESPAYGPPTASRLLRLFGSDREIFLKGRRCENQGLGIGAFVYYRRVVESHKDQIIGQVIRVSERVGAPKETLEVLEKAKKEVQFSKAMESIKDALPQALLVNGRNPLTLLHSALSKGVHELSDERCLELARDVRIVLGELAERLGQALKDEAELDAAVNRLVGLRE